MRTAFSETLCELAESDERIWLLCGDLGYSVLERFSDRFPARFINVGVAEQNMMGLATGLALSGKIVFAYSIANFPVMRCLEQIRNDVCYHKANVKIVAVGGGLSYGPAGYTHHAIEDLAIVRAMPNMTVIAPGDPIETRLATRAIVEHQGPCYLRLGKAGEPVIHQAGPEFVLGRAIVVREGKDVTLITTGGMLKVAVDAADLLAASGTGARVLSMHTIKPIDVDAIVHAAQETGGIATIEEHQVLGGLGSSVADVLQDAEIKVDRFWRFGIANTIERNVGSQDYLRQQFGLTAQDIVKRLAVPRSQAAGH